MNALILPFREKTIINSVGENILLSTGQATSLQVGQTFASLRQITEACYAIKRTRFTEVNPKPEWYDELNAKNLLLKGYADEWLDKYAVVITSTIPSSIKAFAPTFTNSANAIKVILDNGSAPLTAGQLSDIREIFLRLHNKCEEISNNVKQYAREEDGVAVGKLITWKNNVDSAGTDLSEGSTFIQKAHSDLATAIEEYKTKIDTLSSLIKEYQKNVSIGAGLVGAGVFTAIVGGVLCFVFPPVGIATLAVGVSAVIGGAITWGVFQQKINKAYDDIANFRSQINANEATIASLTNLSANVGILNQNSQLAVSNMTDFASTWLTFGNSLKNTIGAIDEGRTKEIRLLINLSLDDAVVYWSDVLQYANRLDDVPSSVTDLSGDEKFVA